MKNNIIKIILFIFLSVSVSFGAEYQISQSTDDGKTTGGIWIDDGTTDYFGNASIVGICNSAVRFSTAIPQGATITSAYLSLYVSVVNTGLLATCSGIDEDDTATFSSTPFGRDHTTASISCNYADWSETSGWSNSNSIITIVQEIVDRPGFGGAIGIVLEDNDSPSFPDNDHATYRTYDYGGGASEFAPKLYVEWATTTMTIGGSPSTGTP